MSYKSRWRGMAFETMHDCFVEGKEKGLSDKAILKLIDASYPFGERAMHPYDMWLKERRNFIRTNLKSLLPETNDSDGGLFAEVKP